jgi:eukaryotic-like serine/threonine-protein kinase
MTDDALFADRYRLERRLGVGGMATVQLAFDSRLERYVAVKLLAEHLAEDASFVSRFRREALAAARLVHPNVVQVFDFGLDDATSRNYIVMEFVDGESCAEILRDHGPLLPRDAVNVLTQACRGLDYAHRNGVVHRDVKPGNLLRSRDNAVKLADFGIAKATEQSDITKVGSVLGTAAYLSPEQARGEPAGPASDLYALGVVSYQLLAGRLPYEAASLTDLARLQETSPPPRLDELNPDVPQPLAEAIMVALHRDPERRYADASDMEQALADGLQGKGRAHAGRDTESTWAMDDTESTRILAGTQATTALPPRERPRRRLEPLPEDRPPPRRERAGQPAAPARRRSAAPPPPRRRGSGIKMWLGLLLVLALVAGGIALYQAAAGGVQQGVQLKEDVQGQVQDAVDELKALIEDNTR